MKILNTWKKKILGRIYGAVAEQGMWGVRTSQELGEVDIKRNEILGRIYGAVIEQGMWGVRTSQELGEVDIKRNDSKGVTRSDYGSWNGRYGYICD